MAILFDLDGVLIDSETEYTEIWADIESSRPTGIKDFPLIIKGTTLPHILSTYFPEELHEGIVKELTERESRMRYDWCPGAEKFLHELKKAGIPSAIVTSSMPDKMEKLLAIHPGLRDLVEVVVDASAVTESKPHPQGYLLAAERLGVNPSDCIVAEDSLQGMEAGKRAGAFVLGITGTVGREKAQGHADILVSSLAEITLPGLINSYNSLRR